MSKKREIKVLVKGIFYSILITLICLFVFSAILAYSNASENIIPTAIIAITVISILLGSIIMARKLEKNGMMNGAILGTTYIISIYLISSFLGAGFSCNWYTIIMIALGIIAGIIGGIIGINK